MLKNYLQILEKDEDRELVEKVAEMLERFDTAMTPIQAENFVLNDIEYPTPYGKFKQSQLELELRLNTLIDFYYDFKETEIEIEREKRKAKKSKDDLDKKLAELKKERLEVKLAGIKNQIRKILKETAIFYRVYQNNPDFHNLTPEKEFELEAEQWARKAINMPSVFEERYGESFMTKALGEEKYKQYKALRRKIFGLLPREIFKIKELKQGEQEKLKEQSK